MKKVIVCSKNPVKIEVARLAFTKMFKDIEFEFEGISAESEVADQPKSDEETLRGAKNRIKNAKKSFPQADFWIGIEGGVEKQKDELIAFAWIIIDSEKFSSKSRTAVYTLPKEVADLIDQGKELGEADDIVFKRNNSKQGIGSVGILTDGVITRTSFYEQAAILALIPFINPELYTI